MSAPVVAEKRASLLAVLFWIGVALAPLAALVLLVADGNGPLRFGAVLAILAVVLIGLSIALRSEGGGATAEGLRNEIEQLRRELRSEIVSAAQCGNQALDQARRAQESVTVLRRRLDAATVGAAAAGITAPAVTEEPAVARVRAVASGTYDDRAGRACHADRAGWGQSPGDQRHEDEPARSPQPGPRYDTGHAVPPGLVHHTETVRVTTRHTVVDGGADTGTLYGGYAGRWSPPVEERGYGGAWPQERTRSGYRDDGTPVRNHPWEAAVRAEPDVGEGWAATAPRPSSARSGSVPTGRDDDRSWSGAGSSGQRSRPAVSGERHSSPSEPSGSAGDRFRSAGRHGVGDFRDEPGWVAPRDEPGWAGRTSAEPSGAASDDADGDRWSELRSGNHWASLRDDEHGREIRVGQRRAALNADSTGTEYRVEDRWASVREPRPDQGGAGPGSRWAEENPPALSAAGVPGSGGWRPVSRRGGRSEWHPPEPEPEPARYGDELYGYPARDDAPRAGVDRPVDRWR